MDIRPLAEETLFAKGFALLPQERKERIRRYRSPVDRQRSLGAGLLLEYGLEQYGISLLADVAGCVPVQTEYGIHGKPCIPAEGAPCFNLTHSGNYAAAVFAGESVGIDMESFRPVRHAMIQRCFSAEEQAYLNAHAGGDAQFTRLWTRKEAYVKAVGDGIHLPLTDFSVLEDQTEAYRLCTFHEGVPGLPERYVLSVCAAEPIATEISLMEAEHLIEGISRNRHPI